MQSALYVTKPDLDLERCVLCGEPHAGYVVWHRENERLKSEYFCDAHRPGRWYSVSVPGHVR